MILCWFVIIKDALWDWDEYFLNIERTLDKSQFVPVSSFLHTICWTDRDEMKQNTINALNLFSILSLCVAAVSISIFRQHFHFTQPSRVHCFLYLIFLFHSHSRPRKLIYAIRLYGQMEACQSGTYCSELIFVLWIMIENVGIRLTHLISNILYRK